MEKFCSNCNSIKQLSEFHKRYNNWQSICKSCKKETDREWYKNNSKKKVRNYEYIKETTDFVRKYKQSIGCKFCSEKEGVALEFHHINDDKEDNVSNLIKHGRKKVIEEIKKCEIICCNCHRKLHAKLL